MKMRTRLAIGILAALLLWTMPAFADQVGLGGAWVDGHSQSGDYGINNGGDQSWGVHLNYDKDLGWKHKLGDHSAIGLDPSMQLFYLHWTKQVNTQEEVCKFKIYDEVQTTNDDCWYGRCHTVKSKHYTHVDSLIAGVGPKAYIELGRFRLYGLGAVGYALQDGAHDDLAVVAQAGVSAQITKNLGLSLDHSEIWVSPTGDYDRFDVTSLNAVLWF